MPLVYKGASPERILLYGDEGSGKTDAWLTIAKLAKITNSDTKFFCGDSDFGVEDLLGGPRFSDFGLSAQQGGNVFVEPIFSWEDYEDHLKTVLGSGRDFTGGIAQPGDFVVIDMLSEAWDALADYWCYTKFGRSMAEITREHKLAVKKGNPLDGWEDYGPINGIWREYFGRLVKGSVKNGVHILATAKSKQVYKDLADKKQMEYYGQIGYRPAGQRGMGYGFQQVLYLQIASGPRWYLTSIKARGREYQTALELDEFASKYLLGFSNWELEV